MSAIESAVKLAELMKATEAEIAKLKVLLETKEKELRKITQEDLPALFQEIGVDGLRLPSGEFIEMVEDIHCGISAEREAAAHGWLINNGYGGIIKSEVAVGFAAEEFEKAQQLVDMIAESAGLQATLRGKVHPSTLKAFLKERLAAGEAVPMETFGVQSYNKVKFDKKAKRAA